MFSSRDPVLAVRVPLATSVTKTTSVPGYQAFFTSLWFKSGQNEMKRRMCSRIYSRSLTNQQLSSLQAPPPPHQVRDTSCSMTSSALVVSESSLSKDECQSFCTGQQSCQWWRWWRALSWICTEVQMYRCLSDCQSIHILDDWINH